MDRNPEVKWVGAQGERGSKPRIIGVGTAEKRGWETSRKLGRNPGEKGMGTQ